MCSPKFLLGNAISSLFNIQPAKEMHHARRRHGDALASFDDKGFAKRAAQHGWVPKVFVP